VLTANILPGGIAVKRENEKTLKSFIW